MEVGRHSVIGPGELWMGTEDPLIAQNMHTTIIGYVFSLFYLRYIRLVADILDKRCVISCTWNLLRIPQISNDLLPPTSFREK